MPPLTRAAILGATGYTALELAKILLRHPHAELVAVTSREPQPLAETHPSLLGLTELVTEPFDPQRLVNAQVDVAFLALPHGASRAAVAPLLDHGIRVIDLSADYRLKDAELYAQHYGEAHGDTANLAHAVYGLPELNREQIRSARLIANPGCYPQTAILSLAPLLDHKLIAPTPIIINSVSGITGAGRAPKLTTLFGECNENVNAYNIGKHRHAPEMNQSLTLIAGAKADVIFAPHLVPMDRGIHSTIYAKSLTPMTAADLTALAQEYYKAEPFVRVRNHYPSTKDVAHTNYCDFSIITTHEHIIVCSVIDNLVRGASGVAVQNMNILFGHPETAGLR